MKTALILGAAAVGAYLLLKHLQGAAAITGGFGGQSFIPGFNGASPAASGMTAGPTAAGTNAGTQMTLQGKITTRPGGMITLGGLLMTSSRTRSLPPTSFNPSSPGVSINQVPDPTTETVNTTTSPTPPIRTNPATGLTRPFGYGGSL